MYNVPYLYLGSLELPLHWLLMLLCCAAVLPLALLSCKKQALDGRKFCLYGLLAAVLGLLIARGIYCAVNWYDVFMDEMGEFAGVTPFFNPYLGSANVMGFAAGLLLAAPIAGKLTHVKAADLLDAAAVPALTLYILARAIEPLSGQGYGDMMGFEVCVCWLEAVLTVFVLIAVCLLRGKVRRPGTLFLYGLILWCLVQILPESLRTDDSLFVLVFARVTHLGLAAALGVTLLFLLWKNRRHIPGRETALDVIGLAAGIIVCIGTIFALDKTNLPKLLIYAVMLLSLAELGFVICRRIHKEDIR